jgi:hypothetical protein
MNMPSFTAEASLYKTSEHYRAVPYNPSAQSGSPIWPAAEVIEIHDCAPGFIKLGEGPNMICFPDPNLTGGDDQGDGPPGDGGPTKGGEGPPRKPAPDGSKKCPSKSTTDQDFLNCESNNRTEPKPNDFVYRPLCTSNGKVNWCCRVRRVNNSYEKCEKIPHGKIDIPFEDTIPLGGVGTPLGGGI